MVDIPIKTQSRIRLNGHMLRSFAWLILQFFLSVGFGAAAFFVYDASHRADADWMGIAAESTLLILSVVFVRGIRQGRTAWHLRLASGREPGWIQILYWVRHARGMRSAALGLVTAAYKLLWSIVLCMPAGVTAFAGWYGYRSGMASIQCAVVIFAGALLCALIGLSFSAVLAQRYCMAPVLLAYDPRVSVRSALRQSIVCMEGKCFSMLCFKISFLPWFLTCALLLPIVYVEPYYKQCCIERMKRILKATPHNWGVRIAK